ncbi:MAG TPA: alpha-hydroxy acid oxidase [Solirubrobacteraceae bacterium]|nr:alpha-hydroxy acid oxidase [Solirubrobacteraceae bacterium]
MTGTASLVNSAAASAPVNSGAGPLNLADVERLAREALDGATWDYFAGGSGDEVTLRANREAFKRIRLRPRILAESEPASIATTALGTEIALPVMVAPTAYHGLVHPDAECATARGAGAAGTIMVVSVNSNRTLEEIAETASGTLWLQLYLTGDNGADAEMISRAESSGYSALVLTVDRPVYGAREHDRRNGFRLPDHLRAANFGTTRDLRARSWTTWSAVEWLLGRTRLPVVLKGVLAGADARIAIDSGVAAVIVSNHGGRQLDGALAGIEALPEVVEAIAGRCEVYCDGGIRRGGDVIKALALGARAVLIGRPSIWGLAIGGPAGVTEVLRMLATEIERDMTLCGACRVGDLDRSLVAPVPDLL